MHAFACRAAIDLPTGIAQQSGNSTVAISTILAGQFDHVRHQAFFICSAPWWPPLG
jgi:hypothetical protein